MTDERAAQNGLELDCYSCFLQINVLNLSIAHKDLHSLGFTVPSSTSIHGQLHPVVVVNFLLYKLSLILNTSCFLQDDLFLLLFMFQEKSKVLGTF